MAPNMGWGCHSKSLGRRVKRVSNRSSSSRSASKSSGRVPPRSTSTSGRVSTPCGQGKGVCRATHFTNQHGSGMEVTEIRVVDQSFSPIVTRKESARWQIICGAVILPQRRSLEAWSFRRRRAISFLSGELASVLFVMLRCCHPRWLPVWRRPARVSSNFIFEESFEQTWNPSLIFSLVPAWGAQASIARRRSRLPP
jgi:hypothetical protein